MPNDMPPTRAAKPAPETDGGSAAADLGLGLPAQERERRQQENGGTGQEPLEPNPDEIPVPTTYPTA